MVRYISEYKSKYRIFIFSTKEIYTKELLNKQKNVGEFINNKIVFYPDGEAVKLSPKEIKIMDEFCDGDVLEISETGIIYRWYSVIEGDAGIATTPKCNSNCIMCPASDGERSHNTGLSLEQIETVIKHMPEDLWYFTITGGEPTLIGEDNFIEIYRTVKEHLPNTNILLLTNGRTLGNYSFFEKFKKENSKNLRIAIPIHGSIASKHDYITQAKGGFEQTIRGLTNIINANIETEIRIVVSKLNEDDILDIAKLIVAKFKRVRVVHFVGLEMRGNCAANADKVVISYEEAFSKSKKAIQLLMINGIDVALYNFPYCMIERGYWSLAKKSISSYKAEYYIECDKCKMKSICCGIFTATRNFYKPRVYPIKGDNE